LKGVYFKLKSDSEPEDVTFTVLQCRLLGILRHRINNGEFTERSLARLVGISQPQVHNVLKGVRKLSPQTADLLLGTLKMTILDLLTQADLAGRWAPCSLERSCRVVRNVTEKGGASAYSPASAYPLKKGPSKEVIPYFPAVERLG
jgi:plasmid maintenance system antidote protein VapI